jgi:hypothetical protein
MGTALFLFWELSLLAFALGVVRRLRIPEVWLGALAVQVLASSLAATAVGFARVNHAGVYGGLAVVALAAGVVMKPAWRWPTRWELAGAAFTGWLFLHGYRPVDEIDSLNYLHFLLEWMNNRLTPYSFSTNYVAFWELGFVPSWVLTRSENFFPFVGLKAVLVAVGALGLIARELELPALVRRAVVMAALAFPFFWSGPTGVGTLKNDAAQAAGVLFLTVALLRVARGGEAGLWLAAGLTLASVKYSGILFAALLVAMMFGLGLRWRALAVPAVVALAGCGHYYLRTLIEHGNPFYPFIVKVGPIALPGTGDLSGTSILASLGDARLWRAFFRPEGGVSPAGLLFPILLPVMLLLGVWLGWRWWRERRAELLLGPVAVAGWLLYFRSFYSASANPGDLAFVLHGLPSLRYVEGILLLGELMIAWWLWRRRVPMLLIAGLFLAQGASRVWLLGLADLRGIDLENLEASPRRAAQWRPAYLGFYEAPAMRVFALEDPLAGYNAAHALVAGRRLRHDVRVGEWPLFDSLVKENWRPEAVVRLFDRPTAGVEGECAATAARMGTGFATTHCSAAGQVLERIRVSAGPALNANPEFGAGGSGWSVSTSAGAGNFEPSAEGMRVRGNAPGNWLVVVAPLPPGLREGDPVTVEAEMRAPRGALLRVHLMNGNRLSGRPDVTLAVGETASGDWQTVRLRRRLAPREASDYFAAGRGPVGAGEGFEIRALRVRRGW